MVGIDPWALQMEPAVMLMTSAVLLYATTYRLDRSTYVRLWCLAMTSAAGAVVAYAAATAVSGWFTLAGHALSTLGAGFIWCASRSLEPARAPSRRSAAVQVGVALTAAVAAWADAPADNAWAGAWFTYAAIAVFTAVASARLWTVERSAKGQFVRATSVAAAAISLLYAGRALALLVGGTESSWFVSVLGTGTSTLVLSIALLVAAASVAAFTGELRTADLARRATRDPLTELLNRAEFSRRAGAVLDEMRATGTHGVLALADLDHFKRINDTFGHDVGDRVLVAFSAAVHDTLRPTDLAGRYGGEEFVFLFPATSPAQAHELFRAVERRLPGADGAGELPAFSMSVGVAVVHPDVDLPVLAKTADRALYEAKRGGRDRLVVRSP